MEDVLHSRSVMVRHSQLGQLSVPDLPGIVPLTEQLLSSFDGRESIERNARIADGHPGRTAAALAGLPEAFTAGGGGGREARGGGISSDDVGST